MMRVLSIIVILLPLLLAGGGGDMATVTYQILTPDGVTFNLVGSTYRVTGAIPAGPPPVRVFTHRVPGQPGAVLENILHDPQVITITHAAFGVADIAGVLAALNDVMANYRFNRAATLQPLRLRVTVDGTAADLYCYYGGAIVSEIDNRHALFGFTLHAMDPYWYATTETSVTDIGADSLAVSYILGKVGEAWTAMGNNGTGAVFDIVADSNDNLYVGGNFDNWAGLGAGDANSIVYWTKSTTTWSILGTGADDTWVNEIIIGPDGKVYVGGTFSGLGGVANTPGIGYWDGAAWNAMGTGVDDNYVADMAMDSNGNLYAGGHFTGMGGVANTAKIAMWNGSTWEALDVGLDGIVHGLAIDANDDVYAVGAFTDVVGGPTGTYNYIIKWDGTAWSALGTGLNGIGYALAVDSDGMVYVAGAFTTADGVTTNYVAKWNGQTFEAMDSGVNATAYHIDVAPSGDIYLSGTFTTAGSDALAVGRMAYWNGTQWNRTDFTLPGAVVVKAFAWDSDDNFYTGFDTTGEAQLSKIQTATLAGNQAFPPTIEIGGPGTLVSASNETTDAVIPFDLYINDGETVTVDLGDPGEIPGGIQISTDWTARPNANNLLGKARAPSSLAQFELVPAPEATAGANEIGVFVTGQPVEAGDGGDILSRWAGITGIDSTNSDNGRLYVSVTVETDGDDSVKALFYEDSAKTSLVASSELAVASTGSRAIVEENGSGLGGTIYQETALGIGADLVVNEGFEIAGGGDPDFWANWAESASDGALADELVIVLAGAHSAKVTAGASINTFVRTDNTPVTAGKLYRTRWYIYGDGANEARIQIYDVTNAANIIPTESGGFSAAAWNGAIRYFEAPVGCANVRIYCHCPATNGGIAYFDNVTLAEVTLAPDTDITVDFSLVTINHWDRFDSLAAAVD